MPIGRFMVGIAALIQNPNDGTYLILRRAAGRDAGAGHWECVTGRVDQGEGFEEAVHREVREELGVAARVSTDFVVGTSHFFRGEAVIENEIVGVIFRCTVQDLAVIQPGAEHDEWRWVTADEAAAMLPDDHWLLRSIRRAEAIQRLMPPALLDLFREQGFNTSS